MTGKKAKALRTGSMEHCSPDRKICVPPKQGVKNMKAAAAKTKTATKDDPDPVDQSLHRRGDEKVPAHERGGAERAGRAESREAFLKWREVPVADRAASLKKLADSAAGGKADAMPSSSPKRWASPSKKRLRKWRSAPGSADYYAENAVAFLKPEEIKTEAKKSYVMFQPLGVVLAIMPWNFPFWQAFRFGVPAVTAGNVVLLKHASNVPHDGACHRGCFTKAGFPDNVFKTAADRRRRKR